MSQAVVILGAGSSADFGVPTLAYMFKDTQAREYLKKRADFKEMLEDLFWKPRGHSLETSHLSVNIEQMLTILRDWKSASDVPDDSKPKKEAIFRRRLKVLIQKAIYAGKSSKGGHLNPLISICGTTFNHTTWASFNWDCMFEASFWHKQMYGNRANPSLAIDIPNWYNGTRKHTYLKLHGGINWWRVGGKILYLKWGKDRELQNKWDEYDLKETEDRPVILEPSFYKYGEQEYKQLEPQWDYFSSQLLKADCVIIVGYSLPEMDTNARSKILTAFQANYECKWLVVDPSPSTCTLYAKLLGTKRATVVQKTLAEFNSNILDDLKAAFPNIDFESGSVPVF